MSWSDYLAWYAGNAWRWADPPDDLYRARAFEQAMLELGWTVAEEVTPALRRLADTFAAVSVSFAEATARLVEALER